jgi:malonate decarboxylase alpha subunit
MAKQILEPVSRSWTTRRDEKRRRIELVKPWMNGSTLPKGKIIEALETLIVSGDRIVLEGDNQKQADFLSRSLVKVDAKRLHDLHLIISSISRPEHLTLFELGVAKKVDFAFAGPQSLRVSQLLEDGQVHSLNHGIGFDTAAIELLLPTYGESLGLRGKICEHWALNPHPTMIPAIESGWVKSIHCFGSEVGMDRYVSARPDIFFIGRDGSLRSNRVLCQLAGQYAVDAFIGSTLQMDADANSSTVTAGRLAGFGGAPNMGHDPHGRRHSTKAWLDLITEDKPIIRGRKLVVQTVETFQSGGVPAFVETLDAVQIGQQAEMPIAPIMIYGDDVSHVVTEEGIAYLYKAEGQEERRRALAAVAGVSPVGQKAVASETAALRKRGVVAYPEDIGVHRLEAKRSLLAARSMEDLAAWSGGTLQPACSF